MSAAPRLAALVDALDWSGASADLCRSWVDEYASLLGQRLGELAARDPAASWLVDACAALPESARRDFLLAPASARQLLAAEHERDRPLSTLGRELARALAQGDPSAVDDPELASLIRPAGRDVSEVRGITLDLEDDFPFPPRDPEAGVLIPPDPTGRARIRADLVAALDTLAEGNPAAFASFRALTLRLSVRDEAGRPGRFTSSSFAEFPGLILLTNPRASNVDAALLIDALVHEAIHSALFYDEAVRRPLVPRGRSAGTRIDSPWSGRALECDQYVQACFVWYGLSRLWAGWRPGTPGVPADRVSQMTERASRGFASRPVGRLLERYNWLLSSDDVAEALRLIERRTAPGG